MPGKKMTCAVCSCFCDDIDVEIQNDQITRIENACLKGSSFLFKSDDKKQRTSFRIDGREVEVEQALDEAAGLLSGSNNPFIYGLDHCSIESQKIAIGIAKKLNGVIDDASSLSHGKIIEHILKGDMPACSLSEIEKTDIIIYWGSNPQHTHPRHLSEFTYYAHPEYNEVSTSRKIGMCVIDVRESETASVSVPFYKLLPGNDRNFIFSVLQGLEGPIAQKDAQNFIDLLMNSSNCIIFVGPGLIYSLKNDFSPLIKMIDKFDLDIKVIPMTDQPNMRGFNHCLYETTGYVNRVSFGSDISSGKMNSLWKQVKNKHTDCIIIIGADPFHNMPFPVLERLKEIPLITIDPFITDTTEASKVVLSSAIIGAEASGSVVRMDGAEVQITALKNTDKMSDEQILKLLLERL